MKTILFSIMLVCSILTMGCFEKNIDVNRRYFETQMDGMLQFIRENYQKAQTYLSQAIELKPSGNSSNYLYAAIAALYNSDESTADKLLNKGITQSYINKDYFYSMNELDAFRHTELVRNFVRNYDSLQNMFFENMSNPHIYAEIDSMIKRDQDVRTGASTEVMSYVDSINIHRLIGITQEYGWYPKAWLILWHQRGTCKEDNEV